MIVFSQGKVFYLAEKCASTSIRKVLTDSGWILAEELPNRRDPWMDWEAYAVVRNPYARMVSYWSYWVKLGIENRSFEDFVLKRDKTPDHMSLVKWYEQCKIEHYLRFESINQEFFSHFGKKLLIENATDHGQWRDHYRSKAVIKKVTEWAGADFKKYGYSTLQ